MFRRAPATHPLGVFTREEVRPSRPCFDSPLKTNRNPRVQSPCGHGPRVLGQVMASPWVSVSSPIRWGLQRCWEVAVGLCPGQRVAQADLWPWMVRGRQVTAWGSQPGRPGSGSSPPLSRCGPQAGSMTLLSPGFLSGIINHPNLASLTPSKPSRSPSASTLPFLTLRPKEVGSPGRAAGERLSQRESRSC